MGYRLLTSLTRLLRDAGFELTVVHGTREPVKLSGVRYVYLSLLSVRDKHRLWLNCSILARTRKHWFRKLISSSSDVVYIPRYCYPLITVAKRLIKRVVINLLTINQYLIILPFCRINNEKLD
ncbi:MAG: hypothetical protein QXX41_14720 [Nitrososphaerota archaeon]